MSAADDLRQASLDADRAAADLGLALERRDQALAAVGVTSRRGRTVNAALRFFGIGAFADLVMASGSGRRQGSFSELDAAHFRESQ